MNQEEKDTANYLLDQIKHGTINALAINSYLVFTKGVIQRDLLLNPMMTAEAKPSQAEAEREALIKFINQEM